VWPLGLTSISGQGAFLSLYLQTGAADRGEHRQAALTETRFKRLGRKLRPKDFLRDHPFNDWPGTPRLLKRRGVIFR
jgi:hypothetical protein